MCGHSFSVGVMPKLLEELKKLLRAQFFVSGEIDDLMMWRKQDGFVGSSIIQFRGKEKDSVRRIILESIRDGEIQEVALGYRFSYKLVEEKDLAEQKVVDSRPAVMAYYENPQKMESYFAAITPGQRVLGEWQSVGPVLATDLREGEDEFKKELREGRRFQQFFRQVRVIYGQDQDQN